MTKILFTLIISWLAVVPRAQAEFLDEAPYWFWADSWDGELLVTMVAEHEEYTGFEYSYEIEATIELADVSFQDPKLEYSLLAYSASGSVAWVIWERRIDAFIEGETGYLDERIVDRGDTSVALDDISRLLMDIEAGFFRIELILPEDFDIPIKRSRHYEVEVIGETNHVHIVEDENFEETVVPHYMGLVEREFPPPGSGLAGVEDMNPGSYKVYTFEYNLKPNHYEAQWREDYLRILRHERARYMAKWEKILQECPNQSCIVCRAAQSALDNVESWINYLADDGVRICKALVAGNAPGLLSRIRSDYSQYIVRNVRSGAAQTANTIHKYLYHFYDAQATSTIDAIYARFPAELRQLYSKERLGQMSSAF